jgi:flavin reductase (DIM6/NTAB) family NADH-FMN oxidoreductase RutF
LAPWPDHVGKQTVTTDKRVAGNGSAMRMDAKVSGSAASENGRPHANGSAPDGNGDHLDQNLGVATTVASRRNGSHAGSAPPSHGLMPDDLRETLSCIPTAVTIVTTIVQGKPHATTVSAFSSLSADPPLVMIALSRSSDLLGMLERGCRFGVNLLSAGQERVGRRCALKGQDKLASVPWYEVEGLPRIEDSAGWLTCEVWDLVPGGDHVIVVGLVTGCESAKQASPLIYHRRRYFDFVA